MKKYFGRIINFIKKKRFKKYWRKQNKHNFTSIGLIFNMDYIDFVKKGGVKVGKNTYGILDIGYTGNSKEKIIIGNNCSIAGGTKFLLGGEHNYHCITTYPYASRIFKKETEVLSKGPIIVDDEVWIGEDTLVLSGVHIGKGAVIASRSVVTKDIPPYAIAAGCPAQIIKYRFSKEIIEKIINLDLSDEKITEEKIKYLYENLTEENVDEIIKKIRE